MSTLLYISLGSSLILVAVYSLLHREYKKSYLWFWTWAWGWYSLRFLFALVSEFHPGVGWLIPGMHFAALISGIFLLKGAYTLLKRKISNLYLFWSGVIGFVWLAAAGLLDFSHVLMSAPVFLFLGFAFIQAGYALIHGNSFPRTSRLITGWTLILWGIHKLDYPFLHTIDWASEWGHLLGNFAAVVVAIGTMVMFFQKLISELHQSKSRFRRIAETARDVIFEYQLLPEPRYLYISPSVKEVTGYRPEEYYRDHLLGVRTADPDDRERILEMVRQNQVPAEPVEMRWERKDGQWIWAELQSVPVYDGEGRLTGIYGIMRDVTQRKSAEEELTRQKERVSTLMNNLPGVAYVFRADEDRTIEFVSQGCDNLLGKSCDLLVKEGNTGWSGFTHPADRQRVSQYITRAIEHNEPFEVEYRIMANDREEKWVAERGIGLKDQEKNIRVVEGFITDITEKYHIQEELRESQRRYKDLFENDLTADLLTTPEGRILDCNQKFLELFQFSSKDEALDFNAKNLYENPRERTGVLQEVREKGKLTSIEFTARGLNGDPLYIIGNVVGNYDEEGDLKYLQVYLFDVTDRKELKDQFLQAQKMEAVGRLAGGVAHDFNNILTVIRGYSGMAMRRLSENNPIREDLELVKQAGDKAAELSKQLLAFSRRQQLHPVHLDANNLLKNLRGMLDRLLNEDIAFRLQCCNQQLPVYIDENQFEQVIMNLVVNAADAMPTGGVLTIETECTWSASRNDDNSSDEYQEDQVIIRVSDTGVGMSQDVMDKIFEPFFTTKGRYKGTGLGLASAYGIIKQSSGEVEVESTPGMGTVFTILLPKATEDDRQSVVTEQIREERGSGHLLLIEDDSNVREMLSSMLEEYGYTVTTASDGNVAQQIVRETGTSIDGIIADVVLPKQSGPELMMALRKQGYRIPVLYISGHGDEQLAERGVFKGEEDVAVLRKPFVLTEILQPVREMMGK